MWVVGDTVTFDVLASFHKDGSIQNCTWSLYEPGAIGVFIAYEGVNMTHTFAENGTWRIELVVKDNWGVEYNPDRPATAPYREQILLDVEAGLNLF